MNEERFMLDDAGELIDKETAQFIEYGEKVCDLLNEQHDEIERLNCKIVSLRVELDTHKHPLWSTREAERVVNELKNENGQLKEDLHNIRKAQFEDVKEFERIYKESDELKEENKELKQQLFEQGTQIDFLKDENTHMRNVLNENKQLKQRNTNQYNQLNELWEIIEEENWEKLIAMKKQLKEDEERLQQEWKCYE